MILRVATLCAAAFFVWLIVVTISGFGDMIGLWEYAEVCTPRDALAFCWTGGKHG